MPFEPKIACIGEAMVELSRKAGKPEAGISFAGDVLNTAIYMKRLFGDRAVVDFVSAVGTDPLSEEMVAMIGAEDIGTGSITRDAARLPGLYAITTDETGERSFSYWRQDSAARQMFGQEVSPDFSRLEGYDILYLSGITLAILPGQVLIRFLEWLAAWKKRTGGTLAFDSNFRPALWPNQQTAKNAIDAVWYMTDIALPSLDDEQALHGEADLEAVIKRFEGYGCEEGAIKRGSAGPVPLDGRRLRLHFEPAEEVIDTTAAGDSFNGAFLASWLISSDLETALAAGHSCASMVIGHRGAIIPQNKWLGSDFV